MPPLYRIAEVSIYSVLNFFPFASLALYPFRHHLRFSRLFTVILIVIMTVIEIVIGIYAVFFAGNHTGIVSAFSTVLYAVFFFLAVKIHFGKAVFTLLMFSNIANWFVIASKCIEGQLFPKLALQRYRWSFSLTTFCLEALLLIPLFYYIKNRTLRQLKRNRRERNGGIYGLFRQPFILSGIMPPTQISTAAVFKLQCALPMQYFSSLSISVHA